MPRCSLVRHWQPPNLHVRLRSRRQPRLQWLAAFARGRFRPRVRFVVERLLRDLPRCQYSGGRLRSVSPLPFGPGVPLAVTVPYCRPPRRTPFKNICGRVALRVFEFFFSPTALTARPEAILEHLDTARRTATCAVVANQPFFGTMRKSVRRRNRALPLMMTEIMLASWETMARRTLMIAQNACSPAEYKRMVIEKAAAFRPRRWPQCRGEACERCWRLGTCALRQTPSACAGSAERCRDDQRRHPFRKSPRKRGSSRTSS